MIKAFTIAALLSMPFAAAAFNSREIKVTNPADGMVLAGTLTVPETGTPRAALVLATGSGSQDRDETVAGHKPFKRIAEYLADRGYAVLRLDDRGTGESGGSADDITPQSNTADVSSGLAWLDSAFSKVPAGVLGHSEGGQIACRIAAGNPACRFIVTLAGPAWRGDSIVMSQSRALAVALTGRWDAEDSQRKLLSVASSTMPDITASPMLYQIIMSAMGPQASLPQVKEYVSAQVSGLLKPWYREFLRYDPADDIKTVKVPWLALNGEKDMQVLPANLNTIASLNPSAETILLPGHNHLFQNASTGMPDEYEKLPEDISDITLETIAAWLDRTFPAD